MIEFVVELKYSFVFCSSYQFFIINCIFFGYDYYIYGFNICINFLYIVFFFKLDIKILVNIFNCLFGFQRIFWIKLCLVVYVCIVFQYLDEIEGLKG